jgi:Fe-S cluster biogenesis protein NfuA
MMFIQTEATPNPMTLKFLPGQNVMGEGSRDFRSSEEAVVSPLASRIFAVDGVTGVFFGGDFITVTKSRHEWQHLKPALLGAIMDHFVSGAPILNDMKVEAAEEEFYDAEHAETVATIKELLEERVKPAVAADGGDISFKGFKDGIVYLAMKGSCAGCPSSTATLKHGIQNLMKHFLPDVKEVRAV